MTADGFKRLLFVSLISSDNDTLDEEVKQAIIGRFGEERQTGKGWSDYNWEYILEPLEDEDKITEIAEHIR